MNHLTRTPSVPPQALGVSPPFKGANVPNANGEGAQASKLNPSGSYLPARGLGPQGVPAQAGLSPEAQLADDAGDCEERAAIREFDGAPRARGCRTLTSPLQGEELVRTVRKPATLKALPHLLTPFIKRGEVR